MRQLQSPLPLLLLLSGCGTLSLKQAHPLLGETAVHVTVDPGMCDAIDAKVTRWTATTIVVGVLSGGSGITSVFTESVPRYVVGGVGIALAAVTALSGYMSTHYAQTFTRKCTQ